MSISKSTLRHVKRQIHAKRVEQLTKALEEGTVEEQDLPAALSGREQMAQARKAAREVFRDTRKAKAAAAERVRVEQPQPVLKSCLTEGGLVSISRTVIGFRLGVEVNPYINVDKGTVGVLVGFVEPSVGPRPVRDRRGQLCHVMTPVGIVEVPAATLRSCSDED